MYERRLPPRGRCDGRAAAPRTHGPTGSSYGAEGAAGQSQSGSRTPRPGRNSTHRHISRPQTLTPRIFLPLRSLVRMQGSERTTNGPRFTQAGEGAGCLLRSGTSMFPKQRGHITAVATKSTLLLFSKAQPVSGFCCARCQHISRQSSIRSVRSPPCK